MSIDRWSRNEIALGMCPDGPFVQLSEYESLARQHREEVEAAAALSVRGWLPIESAPKDGAEIFGWSENTGYDIVVFSGHGWQVAAYGYSREPTHWQPLPSPPLAANRSNT